MNVNLCQRPLMVVWVVSCERLLQLLCQGDFHRRVFRSVMSFSAYCCSEGGGGINGATLVSKTISPGQQPIAQRQAFQNASQGERMTTKRPRNDYEKRLKTTLDSPIITYYNVCYLIISVSLQPNNIGPKKTGQKGAGCIAYELSIITR